MTGLATGSPPQNHGHGLSIIRKGLPKGCRRLQSLQYCGWKSMKPSTFNLEAQPTTKQEFRRHRRSSVLSTLCSFPAASAPMANRNALHRISLSSPEAKRTPSYMAAQSHSLKPWVIAMRICVFAGSMAEGDRCRSSKAFSKIRASL